MRRALLLCLILAACSKPEAVEPPPKPSILLVTLDTTRFDAIGARTPSFNAVAQRGLRFDFAYATAPQTLPSHASMLTGLYPGGHGVHENGRNLAPAHPLAAEKLREAGYRTAAFVSSFSIAKQFGLARGSEVYDDQSDPGRAERSSKNTTDRALQWLASVKQPAFLWVHYFDPHHPYEPSYAEEVATMDAQLGRLLAAFETLGGPKAIVIAADHGEALGEHGESQHGNLLYQGVMHVPLVIAGPGVPAGSSQAPVSTRRVFHTLLDFAGLGADLSLRAPSSEVVLGEAMAPFLQYGWQPQVMAVETTKKAIHAGAIEVYDVAADPKETRDLSKSADLSRAVRQALRDYPIASPNAPASNEPIDDEARRKLASLGYVTGEVKPVIRKDAPRPADMTELFDELEQVSGLFVTEQYTRALPVLETILEADPHNLATALRLASAHSALGNEGKALEAFRRAQQIAPQSLDVRVYLALHYARTGNSIEAMPMLEQIVEEAPGRLPPLEALADLYERQGRPREALELRQRIVTMKTPTAADLARVGQLAMALGRTDVAIGYFENARAMGGKVDLELGVLYLAARRYAEAREALDRAPESPMQLFKRAQVSVLLQEPDRAARIARAREGADESTRVLIERERLFR